MHQSAHYAKTSSQLHVSTNKLWWFLPTINTWKLIISEDNTWVSVLGCESDHCPIDR